MAPLSPGLRGPRGRIGHRSAFAPATCASWPCTWDSGAHRPHTSAPAPAEPSAEERRKKEEEAKAEREEQETAAALAKWTDGYTVKESVDGTYEAPKNLSSKLQAGTCYRVVMKTESNAALPKKMPKIVTVWKAFSSSQAFSATPFYKPVVYGSDAFCPTSAGRVDITFGAGEGPAATGGYHLELYERKQTAEEAAKSKDKEQSETGQILAELCSQCQEQQRACLRSGTDCSAKFKACTKGRACKPVP